MFTGLLILYIYDKTFGMSCVDSFSFRFQIQGGQVNVATERKFGINPLSPHPPPSFPFLFSQRKCLVILKAL